MVSLNNNFLGHHLLEHNVEFSGSDSEEVYLKHLHLQPKDWYYRTNSISYIRNSNGHRCKEIEDIDLNNYILFAGCSHTEGIGLELEKTYPYLISKSLNCDYYNLSIAGTGIDVLVYNLITWFAIVRQKPKIVVIQWPDNPRYILKYNDDQKKQTENNIYTLHGPWNYTNEDMTKFLVAGHIIGFFDTRRTMIYNLIKNTIDRPIIEVAYSTAKFNDNTIPLEIIRTDYARDGMHYGISANLKNASNISNIIKDKYELKFTDK